MLLGNSLRQTVHTHRASVHQAAKLVPALLRVAGVTAGLAKSNGSLPPGLWLASPAGWLPRTGNRDQLRNLTAWATFTLSYMSWNLSNVSSIGFALKCELHARTRGRTEFAGCSEMSNVQRFWNDRQLYKWESPHRCSDYHYLNVSLFSGDLDSRVLFENLYFTRMNISGSKTNGK